MESKLQKNKKYLLIGFKNCFLLLIICFGFLSMNAQDEINNEIGQEHIESNTVREEIQRFIGYEELFYKFITLPYDMAMNANVSGSFIDFSFLFLMFLPILLLFKNIHFLEKIFLLIFLSFVLISSISISYSNKNNIPIHEVSNHLNQKLDYPNVKVGTLIHTTTILTKGAITIFQPIHQLIRPFTAEKDYITLPFLLFGGLWLMFLLYKRITYQNPLLKILTIFITAYSFLWIYLSAGIAWYGILFFPIALALIFISVQKEKKWAKGLVYSFSGMWLLLAFCYRLSDYIPVDEVYAKGLIDKHTLLYQSGAISKIDYMNEFFPKYYAASELINREEESLIYLVSTMLPFFIKKSNQRTIEDDQLGVFNELIRKFPNKIKLAQAMNAYGVRYLIFDLRINLMDKTPEQSLNKKYQEFLKFIDRNPHVELLITDRIVINEKEEEEMGLKGEKLKNFGTFALFQLKE